MEGTSAQNIMVKYAVTDGDGRSAEGVQKAMNDINPIWKVVRQADTTHLGQSQYRHTLKATFNKKMFPGRTVEKRKEQQKALGLDLKYRSHCIFNTMFQKYCGDQGKIAKIMPNVIETTLNCYEGNHEKCRRNSYVCLGGKKTWWTKSPYLSASKMTEMNISKLDRSLLSDLLKLKLGAEALKLTKHNYNTNNKRTKGPVGYWQYTLTTVNNTLLSAFDLSRSSKVNQNITIWKPAYDLL